jgi:hypothetical protein
MGNRCRYLEVKKKPGRSVLPTVAALGTIGVGLACNSTSLAASIIPLELHDPNAPVLMVKINDLPVRLWIDLGDSTPLTLQKSVLDAIEAVPTGDTVKMQGVDGIFEVPTYKIPRVQIGADVFTNVTANLDSSKDGHSQGFLGSGLLKGHAVVLDYPHRRMVLIQGKPSSKQALCTGTAVKFSDRPAVWEGEAFTEADTDFGRVTLAWDTGSQMTLLNQAVSRATDRIVSTRFLLGGRDFGPYSFGLLVATLPSFDGAVGDDFFLKHRVCIDYPGRRVVIGE